MINVIIKVLTISCACNIMSAENINENFYQLIRRDGSGIE